jgi:3-methyladenine DNA glycosylase AlkD
MRYEEILEQLKSLSDTEAISGMEQYGIKTRYKVYGLRIPDLRRMAREIGKDHQFAQQLWKLDFRETKILASMIDDPEVVTEEQMDEWVQDFDNWEICDQCCMNLFEKTRFAYQKCFDWSSREEEFVKRAGFVLMARLAVSDKKADDKQFEQFFPVIKREAGDDRNYVKKAVNWALRQIGKRNIMLNKKAIAVAQTVYDIKTGSAKWIASDAIREITSEAVQERLKTRKG